MKDWQSLKKRELKFKTLRLRINKITKIQYQKKKSWKKDTMNWKEIIGKNKLNLSSKSKKSMASSKYLKRKDFSTSKPKNN